MKDKIFKIKTLYYLIYDQFKFWKKEIWNHDLNDYYCCDGNMCGCQGITLKEEWNYRKKEIKNN